jgi:mono/diheme cytochrome c family protein
MLAMVHEPHGPKGTSFMRTIACLSRAAWLTASLSLAAGTAAAQTGDAQRGRELAERICSSCHNVRADPAATLMSDVVSFASVANRPGVTAEMLAGRIIVPHPAMPDVQLSVRELRDVIAYILSLKKPK